MNKEENLMAAFRHFDTDGSGTISRQELKEALKARMPLRVPSIWLATCALHLMLCLHALACNQHHDVP